MNYLVPLAPAVIALGYAASEPQLDLSTSFPGTKHTGDFGTSGGFIRRYLGLAAAVLLMVFALAMLLGFLTLPHPQSPESQRTGELCPHGGIQEVALSCLAGGKQRMGTACYLFSIQYSK